MATQVSWLYDCIMCILFISANKQLMLSLQLATTIILALLCNPTDGQIVESDCTAEHHIRFYIMANASDNRYVKFKPCLELNSEILSVEMLTLNLTPVDVIPYWNKQSIQHIILEVSCQLY